MQYSTLIAQIEADIYSNGAELITGDILQTVLKRMVSAWASAGAAYGGTISPDTVVPLSLDQATVYLALTAGTYEHFLDGEGDPIETTGPALVIYDGGPALIFTKTDLPSSGSGATVITNDGSEGDSVAIRLTDSQTYKRGFRIDVTGIYTGGDVIQRIGSLLIECFDEGTNICHGYYYGDAMADILIEVAVYLDDTAPDTFYLMLTNDSSLDSVTFAITPLDGGEVDAFFTNAGDDHTKIEDATITRVGGDGKMGVISQTQTWAADYGSYTISNKVYGIIPQSFIDKWKSLVYSWGTFNATSGYFELNGLTDISYNEAIDIVNRYNPAQATEGWRPGANAMKDYFKARTSIPCMSTGTTHPALTWNVYMECSHFFYRDTDKFTSITQYGCLRLKKLLDKLNLTANISLTDWYALEECYIQTSKDITASQSKYLSLASIVYMVDNATNTGAVTYTFHASAYARCRADTTEYTYGGNTYTGIIALATAKNITIASA